MITKYLMLPTRKFIPCNTLQPRINLYTKHIKVISVCSQGNICVTDKLPTGSDISNTVIFHGESITNTDRTILKEVLQDLNK